MSSSQPQDVSNVLDSQRRCRYWMITTVIYMIMMKMQVMMIINITYMIIDDNLEDDTMQVRMITMMIIVMMITMQIKINI